MQPYYTPQHVRSAIPRVVGIIAIIFAVIGVGCSAIWTWGSLHDIKLWGGHEKLGFVVNWLYLWMAVSVVLFAVHLTGGVMACTYKPLGLRLLTGYAVGALVLIAIDLIVVHGFVSGRRWTDSITIPRTVFAAIAVVWPIVVLALVNTRRAKAACGS